MLKYSIRGENIEVTAAIRDYIQKKLNKLEKYFEDTSNSTAHVNLKVYSDKTSKVEVRFHFHIWYCVLKKPHLICMRVPIW